MNKAIVFENVGKMYRLGRVGTGTLHDDLNRWWTTQILRREDPFLRVGETNDRTKSGGDYVWALRDVSFDVQQGEVVGIIGRNGAGKSTLLKLLSRITSPTKGRISYKGRIASLLEVGTGFNPEFTGRENIYMNGSLMGMSRKEISRKLDEIVDFAGIERYLDTPIKRYSSGMEVRLGFAISAFLEPDILVVDEVLAVGDAEFQKKAIGKMQNVSAQEGRTVLYVSHNMGAVKSLCSRGLVLDCGEIRYDGRIDDAVDYYIGSFNQHVEGKRIVDSISFCQPILQIEHIRLNETEMSESTITANQEYLKVEIDGLAKEKLINFDVRVQIRTLEGVPLAAFVEGHYRGRTETIPAGPFHYERNIRLPQFLAMGDCLVDIYLHQPDVCHYMRADSCALLHVEGGIESFGQVLEMNRDGFFGLTAD